METLPANFSKVCRTCNTEFPDMRSIFEAHEICGEKTRADEMLMNLASVKVNIDDGITKLMCNLCINKLKAAYEFKMLCETTDSVFRNILEMKNTIIKMEQQNINSIGNDIIYDIFNNCPTNTQTGPVNNKTKEKNSQCIFEESLVPDVIVLDQTSVDNSDYIHFLDNNQLLLTCKACMKTFTTVDGLKCHKRLHTGKMFECSSCNKQFTRWNHLQRHMLCHSRKKAHVCKICNKTLTRFEHLKRHLVTHLKEKPYSCNDCNRGFNRMEHLVNHSKRCKGDRVHICDICNKAFNRLDSLEVHKQIHENKLPELPTLENLNNIEEHYYEIDCDDSTFPPYTDGVSDDEEEQMPSYPIYEKPIEEPPVLMAEDVKKELQSVQEIPVTIKEDVQTDETVSCDSGNDEHLSNKIISQEENCAGDQLDDSLYTGIEDGMVNNSDDSDYEPKKELTVKRGRGRPRKNPPALPKQKSPGKRGRPPKISKTRKAPKVISEDINEFEEEEDENNDDNEEDGEHVCPKCQKVFNKSARLEYHMLMCVHGIFKCRVCKKEFSKMSHLKRHLQSHSQEKPFICDKCPKTFYRRDHFKHHLKHHGEKKEYQCDICEKKFAKFDHLQKHKLNKHSENKPVPDKKYQCHVCLKFFTTEKYRDFHMKGHNGEKKFQCKYCDKTFLSKSNLTEHVKFHNDNSKKFLCSECGQRFIRNDYLVIHMRRHRGEKPFKCKYCGKGFPRTTDLTVHERYHTGEKTHLCTVCGRGFGRAYNLTVHMRTHTGEKPYQCTYCEAAFAQGNDLKAHIRRHTGERFHCDLCPETFLMGYLLTAHKRMIHGLNIVSNIRRLQPVNKNENKPDDPPPVTVTLPQPVVPTAVFNQFHAPIYMQVPQENKVINALPQVVTTSMQNFQEENKVAIQIQSEIITPDIQSYSQEDKFSIQKL